LVWIGKAEKVVQKREILRTLLLKEKMRGVEL
jgi:hypothetical protein